ncbi:unnamed protein product [Discosporangium mesarthrocarpum]
MLEEPCHCCSSPASSEMGKRGHHFSLCSPPVLRQRVSWSAAPDSLCHTRSPQSYHKMPRATARCPGLPQDAQGYHKMPRAMRTSPWSMHRSWHLGSPSCCPSLCIPSRQSCPWFRGGGGGETGAGAQPAGGGDHAPLAVPPDPGGRECVPHKGMRGKRPGDARRVEDTDREVPGAAPVGHITHLCNPALNASSYYTWKNQCAAGAEVFLEVPAFSSSSFLQVRVQRSCRKCLEALVHGSSVPWVGDALPTSVVS